MLQKSNLLAKYISFLRNHQCSSEATIDIRKKFAERFLDYLEKKAHLSRLSNLSAKTIHDYIIITGKPLRRSSKKHLSSSIRSFLRFAYIKGFLKQDLLDAVPVITTWKLDRLPQGISWEDSQKLLTLPDKNTPFGRRDFAILSLLIYYGVRIGQVTNLKLSDIYWQEGFIYFAATKHSNALRLPLYKEVADALLTYIKKDRRNSQFQMVFLTGKGVQRPLSKHNHYYSCLKKYYVKAGIVSTSQGSRVIRHAFATRLINKKTPIKTIADLLGHRWIETTFIYTKVDIVKLRELARDWPEVLS